MICWVVVTVSPGSGQGMAGNQIGSLDLNLILVFDALFKYQSVTRAAASLHVTQSAVSHSLARLRAYFDDQLFTRSAGGITPTPYALDLSTTVVEIANLIRNGLLSQAAFKPEAESRTLTLSMTDLGECSILPTLMRALREISPGCVLRTVQTQPDETREMLASGDVDIAIGSILALPTAQSEIYGQKLYTQSNVVLAHAEAFEGQTMDLDAYCSLPQVAVAPIRGQDSIIDRALSRFGRRRQVVVTTDHHMVIPYLIKADKSLIATVPRIMSELCRSDPSLVTLELPLDLPNFEVFQYWHARVHKDRLHVWFRGLIAQFFQRRAGQAMAPIVTS